MIAKLRSGGLAAVLVAVLGVALAGCNEAPPAPPMVIVNTPAADGGPVVLLTVMIVAAFVLLSGVAVVLGWGWASERRARREAEEARRDAEEMVIALTGQPLRGARLVIDRGVVAEQRPAAGRSMARWSE